jgi:hypothetical protein
MGRWGDDIYDSDDALEYLDTIIDLIQREVVYWFAPEQVLTGRWWLAHALAVIEVILLFEQHEGYGGVHLESVPAVQRWRETFFTVWDGDWDDTNDSVSTPPYDFSAPAYRQAHRSTVSEMFDRVEHFAHQWSALGSSDYSIPALSTDYSVPLLSARTWTQGSRTSRFLNDFTSHLLEQIRKDIFYFLSHEMKTIRVVDPEDVWMAVDVLGYLCKAYQYTPGVNEAIVQHWREETITISRYYYGESQPLEGSDPLYQNILAAFQRLEDLAKQYPPTQR